MMSVQGSLSIERMCRLAGVSRAGFYRCLEQEYGVKQDLELRSEMQRIALQNRRRYGYRRMGIELEKRGFYVNHKRILRLMREDNLLALGRRKFVRTTQSKHSLPIYLNLARRMKLTGLNQLWVADITYIRLQTEFVFLAVVLDAYSRKVMGWALERYMTTTLVLTALRQALRERQPPPGLVHHSDQGIQYASAEYVQVLEQHGILLSMSRAGNPYDNATCESWIKTLKVEEIYANQYHDLEHLRSQVAEFIEQYYNRCRLHSALGYRSPEEFERQQAAEPASRALPAAAVSFSGHGEIFQCNGEQPKGHSPTHCLDESPTGYSWAGCSPAEPACASPANPIVKKRILFE
jgi:transposase InsO family protein